MKRILIEKGTRCHRHPTKILTGDPLP